MISVILYGRNDSYGYNLHKRAALSLNCIAEVLTHAGDEIIFVDCNTPDYLPTFPEAVQDTLTQKAKKLLRILRLRPQMYEKYKKGSPLPVLEPLCRNIAVRRHNPSNRWILSTNTDMVFAIRTPGKSLSDIVAELPDGFYELPRFEVPEALWETVDRGDPAAVIETFRHWGTRLHLNEVVVSEKDIRFDGPGDFQLMLRDQILAIHGFNEEMVLGWHVDSNLARRLYLLNGRTESLLDHVFAYHCSHTREATFLHSKRRTGNDLVRFRDSVTSPYLPEQAETWGTPHEEIKEISLSGQCSRNLVTALEEMLPGSREQMTWEVFSSESFDHGLIYDTSHTFPFLANCLATLSPHVNLAYFGGNVELFRLLGEFLEKQGHTGQVLADLPLMATACPPAQPDVLGRYATSDRAGLIEQSDILIFDAGMMHLPQVRDSAGISFPASHSSTDHFKEELQTSFLACVRAEQNRLRAKRGQPRRFILVGTIHTWFEALVFPFMEMTLAPYSTHVRQGYLRNLPAIQRVRAGIRERIILPDSRYKRIIRKIPLLNFVAGKVYDYLIRLWE